ncbi:type IV secretory pathway VirB2 component (pilin) [Rhizobium skierniewicense]|uniref:Type IV secretory pathway VirB2 component (Pilin) n=1 Tax=Rhizobium skierniewicense TaxID=984260 RepID=A0A7W6C7Q3_9HYPH|nr:hypothetical protein [Rhizobium skierniewicense]MBB3947277.1 type IV secretory pathway VirB2 component (pilin) [Rhizobium skierniewicense]
MNAPYAAQMASDGNWGEAFGQMILGPLGFFLAAHVVIYYGLRLVRGPSKLKSFSATKLNYIALSLALMGILGAVAQRANPTL